ncbi:nuclear transport factor 2 family protein [Paenibacillus nitricinens]|uniref:nuclear transport factor 2 family protein n=1 Tax=Paenibacillus TaxID=44249 RepID=UPI0030F65A0C
MLKQLPQPVEIYMDSLNTNDNVVMDVCMAKDAHIHDIGENNHFHGIEAIKEWRGKSNDEFKLKSEVIDVENKYGIIIVTSLTSGIFPGSPQLFYYFFTIADDLITNIEIVPGAENVNQ